MKHIRDLIGTATVIQPEPIKTGFRFLDETIGGYYPGELTTLCGFEDSGKTAFVITQINRIAVDHHIPTLLVLDNMKLETFISLMATYYCGITTNDIHSVLTSPLYKDCVSEYLDKLKAAPLYIWEENFLSTEDIEISAIEDIIKEQDIRIVFYDELMNYYDYNNAKAGNILKRLALNTNVPVVATCSIVRVQDSEYSAEITLSSFCRFGGFHGSDVIISITDFEKMEIYTDERGRRLRGIIQLKVLKYKGTIERKRGLFDRKALFMRKAAIEMKKLNLMKQNAGDNILLNKLIEDMGLDIIEDSYKDEFD